MRILLGDFNEKTGGRVFSKQKMEMTVYLRIVVIMVLEQQTLPHQKSSY
jgi:hypothetical protein